MRTVICVYKIVSEYNYEHLNVKLKNKAVTKV